MVKFQRQGLKDGWKTGFIKGLSAEGGLSGVLRKQVILRKKGSIP